MLQIALAADKKKERPSVCNKRNLELKDCHLRVSEFDIHIWQDKFILQGPVKRSMKTLPLFGEDVRWHSAQTLVKNNRSFVQMVIWGPPQGLGEVESAHYFVYEIKPGVVEMKLEKVIQKRKKRADGKMEADKKLKTDISAKSNKVIWKVGDESGEL